MRKLSTLVFVAIALSQLGSTDCGQVLDDPGFDLWCGDQLCDWKVVSGSVTRVPTWNRGDSGVQLAGGTAIEQLSVVTSRDGTCIKFDVIANIAPETEVDLEVDVDNDGTIDYTQRLPAASWQPLSFELEMPQDYTNVRFVLSQPGAGSAVLANIAANIEALGCAGVPPIVNQPP